MDVTEEENAKSGPRGLGGGCHSAHGCRTQSVEVKQRSGKGEYTCAGQQLMMHLLLNHMFRL